MAISAWVWCHCTSGTNRPKGLWHLSFYLANWPLGQYTRAHWALENNLSAALIIQYFPRQIHLLRPGELSAALIIQYFLKSNWASLWPGPVSGLEGLIIDNPLHRAQGPRTKLSKANWPLESRPIVKQACTAIAGACAFGTARQLQRPEGLLFLFSGDE